MILWRNMTRNTEKGINNIDSEPKSKKFNLDKIKSDLSEIKKKLPVKRLLFVVTILLCVSLGYIAVVQLNEAKNNQRINNPYTNPTQTQYVLEEGIYMQATEGPKSDFCVIQLAGEGLAALPDGCAWQMNLEGKLFLFNETDKTLVLILKNSLSEEEIANVDELSIENGNTVYRLAPNQVSSYLAPSEIKVAYFE